MKLTVAFGNFANAAKKHLAVFYKLKKRRLDLISIMNRSVNHGISSYIYVYMNTAVSNNFKLKLLL